MTKRIIFILLAVFWGLGLQAQTVEKDGTYYYDAIPVTFDIGKMIFTDVRDTRKVPAWYNSFIYMPKGSSHYQKTQGNAVFYRMEIPASGNVIVHNWNSRMGFSSLFVYRLLSELQPDSDVNIEEVEIFEEGDFMSPDFDPEKLGIPEGASHGLAYIHLKNLPAGTYFIITAGYKYMNGSVPNGELGITIIADLSPGIPDEPEILPEEPDNSPVCYQYDQSGNRIKTNKK